ncbi:MAG TPA: glycoside hydrolase family 27 protein [Candidatus Choladousia intestinavium]|uniref:Alpha-galactosidase n=1 Tax=Candidatus Choladousia intestinavium TaxID=2840727 RepID=A0A9D1ADJ1_9FIRM|nr:glycoside hydrolase family 27 protein [Candidatus Choladousia intestinavium]
MNKNEFAVVPPMGWNSFDYYDANVTEQAIRANAEYMAKYLKPYGWEYIVIDIQWYAYDTGTQREKYEYIPFSQVELDEYGRLLPCPDRFPSSANGKGFAPLAEYIHSLGLKFGIHIMRGIARSAAERHLPVKGTNATAAQIANPSSVCLWNPDMYGVSETFEGQCYYDSIIELYASWGVDFIKCDDICNSRTLSGGEDAQLGEIRMLSNAIQKSGRPMVLSLSPGPALTDRGSFYANHANMWRLTGDMWDNWEQLRDMFDRCEKWAPFVKKGCYPDCDMLPIGRLGKEFLDERQCRLTYEEQKTMMTLWCITHSPLMLGAELTKMDDRTFSLITQKEVLSLNQNMDHTVLQLYKDERQAVWVSQTSDQKFLYIAIFNFRDKEAEISVTFRQLSDKGIQTDGYTKAADVWEGSEITAENPLSQMVPPHGVKLLKLEK